MHNRVVSLGQESSTTLPYDNHVVATVNDHVVRISTMTGPYPWHLHPDSDESFLGMEGCLVIELEDQTIELHPGDLFTVRRGVRHRTKPQGSRSVNLTFEQQNARTELLDSPQV